MADSELLLDPHGREAPDRVLGAVPAEEMLSRLRGVDRACEDRKPPTRPAGDPQVAMACTARW